MARVFVPQITMRINQATRTPEPVFDFTPAEAFGTLEVILDGTDKAANLSNLSWKIRRALDTFRRDDFILAVGDPSVIGLCCAIIALNHRCFYMLKWDRKTQIYNQVEIRP